MGKFRVIYAVNVMTKDWHSQTPDEVLEELGVTNNGLTSQQAQERLEQLWIQ